MPKTSIDYSKTKNYKICCKDSSVADFYIGHTTDLVKRRYLHKSKCSNPNIKEYNYYIYEFIRSNGGWNNWDIRVVEECNCKNHNEALQRERYWFEKIKPTLNKQVPSRTDKEYQQEYRQNHTNKNKENKSKHK